MSRYVDLSEKVTATYYDEQYEEWTHHTVTVEDVLNEVCDDYTILPTIEPRKGRWIEDGYTHYKAVCSECGEPCATYIMGEPRDRFCKWCGAKMDIRGEEE